MSDYYGREIAEVPVETVSWRLNVSGPIPDFDIVWIGLTARGRIERQIGKNSRLVDLKSIGKNGAILLDRIPLPQRQVLVLDPVNPANQPVLSPEGHFQFLVGTENCGQFSLDRVRGRIGIEISHR